MHSAYSHTPSRPRGPSAYHSPHYPLRSSETVSDETQFSHTYGDEFSEIKRTSKTFEQPEIIKEIRDTLKTIEDRIKIQELTQPQQGSVRERNPSQSPMSTQVKSSSTQNQPNTLAQKLLDENSELSAAIELLKKEIVELKQQVATWQCEATKWEQKYQQLERQKEVELQLKDNNHSEALMALQSMLEQQKAFFNSERLALSKCEKHYRCPNCQTLQQELAKLRSSQEEWKKAIPNGVAVNNETILQLVDQLSQLSQIVEQKHQECLYYKGQLLIRSKPLSQGDIVMPTLKK